MVLKVPIAKVRAGMRTARPIYHDFLILLQENQIITTESLRRLRQWGIGYLVVHL